MSDHHVPLDLDEAMGQVKGVGGMRRNKMTILEEAKRLLELESKATPGKWKFEMGKYHARAVAEHPTSKKRKQYVPAQSPQMLVNISPQRLDDFQFIVASRNSLRPILEKFCEAIEVLREVAPGLKVTEWNGMKAEEKRLATRVTEKANALLASLEGGEE